LREGAIKKDKTALAAGGQNGAKARPTLSAGTGQFSLCGQSGHNCQSS